MDPKKNSAVEDHFPLHVNLEEGNSFGICFVKADETEAFL